MFCVYGARASRGRNAALGAGRRNRKRGAAWNFEPCARGADIEQSGHGIACGARDLIIGVTGAAEIREQVHHISLATLDAVNRPDDDLRDLDDRSRAAPGGNVSRELHASVIVRMHVSAPPDE